MQRGQVNRMLYRVGCLQTRVCMIALKFAVSKIKDEDLFSDHILLTEGVWERMIKKNLSTLVPMTWWFRVFFFFFFGKFVSRSGHCCPSFNFYIVLHARRCLFLSSFYECRSIRAHIFLLLKDILDYKNAGHFYKTIQKLISLFEKSQFHLFYWAQFCICPRILRTKSISSHTVAENPPTDGCLPRKLDEVFDLPIRVWENRFADNRVSE